MTPILNPHILLTFHCSGLKFFMIYLCSPTKGEVSVWIGFRVGVGVTNLVPMVSLDS